LAAAGRGVDMVQLRQRLRAARVGASSATVVG
jgi:hypothetical protein